MGVVAFAYEDKKRFIKKRKSLPMSGDFCNVTERTEKIKNGQLLSIISYGVTLGIHRAPLLK